MARSAVSDADAQLMARISAELLAAVDATIGPWVIVAVTSRRPDLADRARHEAQRCRTDIVTQLEELFALDIDAQQTTPLAVLRTAGAAVARVLDSGGEPRPVRDPFDVRANPEDVFGVGPSTWSDLGDEVAQLGIAWGAGKAHLHLRRHRPGDE